MVVTVGLRPEDRNSVNSSVSLRSNKCPLCLCSRCDTQEKCRLLLSVCTPRPQRWVSTRSDPPRKTVSCPSHLSRQRHVHCRYFGCRRHDTGGWPRFPSCRYRSVRNSRLSRRNDPPILDQTYPDPLYDWVVLRPTDNEVQCNRLRVVWDK